MYITIRRTITKLYEQQTIQTGSDTLIRMEIDCTDINEDWDIRKQRNKIIVILTNKEYERIKQKGYYFL